MVFFVSYLLQRLPNLNDPTEDGFILFDFILFYFIFFDLKPNTISLNIFFIKYKFDKFIVRLYFFVNIQTKVCGAIGYELTFLALKAFINYISLKFLGLCILVLPLKLRQPLLLAHYSQLFVSLAFS